MFVCMYFCFETEKFEGHWNTIETVKNNKPDNVKDSFYYIL